MARRCASASSAKTCAPSAATDGTVGLVSPRCPHRGADLFFGRNENGGIRCAYHGWKFAADGRCLATPTMEPGPAREKAEQNIHLHAYPMREAGGFVWAYLGPREHMPALPELEFRRCRPRTSSFPRSCKQCNWAQACEGGLDTAHFSFLHMAVSDADDVTDAADDEGVVRIPTPCAGCATDGAPRFTIADHPAGLVLGAARQRIRRQTYWRISQFLMPNHGLAPNAFPGENYHGQCWVPIDDTSCWIYNYTWNPERPLSAIGARAISAPDPASMREVDADYIPLRRRENDYLHRPRQAEDRDLSRGSRAFPNRMPAIQDSQGLIADRTAEHLGPTDMGVIRFRRMILDAARDAADGQASRRQRATGGCIVSAAAGRLRNADVRLPEVMRARFGHDHGLAQPAHRRDAAE